jgi:hypothetical protein
MGYNTNDTNQQASLNNPLEVLIKPITRSETKRIQDELIGLILDVWINKLQIYNTRPSCIV